MYLTPFFRLFPDQAWPETRTFRTRGRAGLPDDDYAILEAYCTDPKCECRRVMLNVVGKEQGKSYLASISFGFDRDDEMAGPFLDPINPQSRYAGVLLDIVTLILSDPRYAARLESHYDQVKQAAADPTHPIQDLLKRDREHDEDKLTPRRRNRKIKKK